MNALKPRPPFDVLVVMDEDRLGREQIETAWVLKQIVEAGVRVFSYLTDRERTLDGAMDKITLALATFGAELEREKAKQRTHDALRQKALAGHVPGGQCYGYRNVEVLLPQTAGPPTRSHVIRQIEPKAADTVRRIYRDFAAGRGLKGLAADLNRDGAPPPHPRRRGAAPGWTPSALREILRRPLYRGEWIWNRTRTVDVGGRTSIQKARPEAEWIRRDAPELRIVSDDLWAAVQARLAVARRRAPTGWTRGVNPRPALLAGLATCATCGAGIIRRTRAHGRGGGQWVRVAMYACGARARSGVTVCPNRVELREDLVDRAILRALADVLARETLDQAIETALDKLRRQRTTGLDRRVAVERELSLIVARQDRLAHAIAEGEAMAPLLARMKAEETRKAALLEELATLDGAAGLGDLALARTQRVLRAKAADVRGALGRRPDEAKAVLGAFVQTLTLAPVGTGRARGYRFAGTGSYGPLLGETTSPSGGSNGVE
jgi:hypothetical protein